jgi:hypothetical protein
MPDDKHGVAGVGGNRVCQPGRHPVSNLAVALPVGKWRVDVKGAPRFDFAGAMAREIAVVAFTKAGIADDWKTASPEGNFGRLKRTREV